MTPQQRIVELELAIAALRGAVHALLSVLPDPEPPETAPLRELMYGDTADEWNALAEMAHANTGGVR